MDDASLEDVARGGRRQEVMALPVGAMLRALMLNHWYPTTDALRLSQEN
jgi:hypothetical protein